jgi:hypothetical protein
MDSSKYTIIALSLLFIFIYWKKFKNIFWPPLDEPVDYTEKVRQNGIGKGLQKNEILSTEGKTIFVDAL